MSHLIQIADFIGQYKIVVINQDEKDNLQSFIDKVENEILLKLFGKELKDLFIADLDSNGVPQTAKYLKLYNEILLQRHCIKSFEVHSSGMKPMLLFFVYHKWYNKAQVSESINGLKQLDNSNSQPFPSATYMVNRYNESVGNYKVIQDYISQNMSEYEDFKGVDMNYLMLF
jgi:hypothetical protein